MDKLVTMMMHDGVDMDVINDVVMHPTKYIQMLGICDGEYVELPMYCYIGEHLLTEEEKINALDILSDYIGLWYAITSNTTECTVSNDDMPAFSEDELAFLLSTFDDAIVV